MTGVQTCALPILLETDLPADWHAETLRGAQTAFPVTAADLMPDLQGPALGARLKDLQNRWLDSNLRLNRDELLG